MDWNLAIERNCEALKRIVAMLVAMAAIGPHFEAPTAECRTTLPRTLHRAILRLLRPAESAVRRLVIVMARGLVATPAPARPRKAKPRPTILRNGVGTGILLPAGFSSRGVGGGPAAGIPCLPLFDPLRPFQRRPKRPVADGIPRISLPGVTAPFPVAPRKPPAPDDPLDAARLGMRLRSLGATLDDLPRQAWRFARWRAARDAAGAQARSPDSAGAPKENRRTRRIAPLRPGRPPGQRPAARQRTHDVHEILHDLHGLAFDVLEQPDTS
jgi:hypothetical protein